MNIRVLGQQVLSGEITPSGSKNSAVALIPATVLLKSPVKLMNIPDILDVTRLINILKKMGSSIEWNKDEKTMIIDNSSLSNENMDESDLGTMRGTSLLWGPMLARFGKVTFDRLPGGCTLGVRSHDPQYRAFRDLGVAVQATQTSAYMDSGKAVAGEILLTEMSPTVTENAVMFATSLPGMTTIYGAASEPQVQDLCTFLINCGAKIEGVGTNKIVVEGGSELAAADHRLLSDHYEIATFLALAAATGGSLRVHNALPGLFKPVENTFSRFGVKLRYENEDIILDEGNEITIDAGVNGTLNIKAQPWPALPVDTLPLFIPLALSASKGQVLFHNWMYESGLFWTSELTKLGANIIMCDPHRVIVIAGKKLHGATLEAPYIIRAVVAMVMAAMVASGESVIIDADALYRGHPHFADNLRSIGANIEEIE